MQTVFLLIYTFFYLIALLFLFPKEYLKRPKEIRNRWIREKLGFFRHTLSKTSQSSSKPKIWIHAVSVGEVIALSKLIKKLSQKYEIILSTITDTGQKVALQKFSGYEIKVIYLPFDTPCAIRRTLKFFNPKAVILTETELWPNLIFFTSKKIPLVLVNGRLSEGSFKGYSKIKFFIKPLLKKFSLICAQEEIYKKRFIKLGADKKKVYITGNMKFDIELKTITFIWENSIPRPVILAGSTHKPEEEIILKAFLNLSINGTLILAPRHPERFEEVETLIKTKIAESKGNFFFSKLTEMPSTLNAESSYIVLANKMGILGSLYRICDLAIIGGSFIPHGGQNPLEPAYWKKPIICGPHMHNFPFIQEFLKEGACLMVDQSHLQDSIKKLIEEPQKRLILAEKAHKILSKNSGATEKTLKLLRELISN